MIIDITVPEAGESITQVELARWLVGHGDWVTKDQEIAEIDSDKATLTLNAPAAGRISIEMEEGSSTAPGKRIAQIDTEAPAPAGKKTSEKTQTDPVDQASPKAAPPAADNAPQKDTRHVATDDAHKASPPGSVEPDIRFSPHARKLLDELGMVPDSLLTSSRPDGKRITKKDVLRAVADSLGTKAGPTAPTAAGHSFWPPQPSRDEDFQKMSTLRKKVAERLVAVKNQTAMLTTFNEVDMSAVMALRRRHQEAFTQKHGIKLGFMSFFARAVVSAIPHFPQVNARIENGQLVAPAYADIGIAVSTPKGLMVPVIRNAEHMGIPQLEARIQNLAEKARNNRIGLEELSGGTFSITNGGVFGSLLSTPIINPPQCAILGMHTIQERPVAINKQVEIRPMMYLALSYDHRIVDGRESVGFLLKVKELIENPLGLLLQGQDPARVLLEL